MGRFELPSRPYEGRASNQLSYTAILPRLQGSCPTYSWLSACVAHETDAARASRPRDQGVPRPSSPTIHRRHGRRRSPRSAPHGKELEQAFASKQSCNFEPIYPGLSRASCNVDLTRPPTWPRVPERIRTSGPQLRKLVLSPLSYKDVEASTGIEPDSPSGTWVATRQQLPATPSTPWLVVHDHGPIRQTLQTAMITISERQRDPVRIIHGSFAAADRNACRHTDTCRFFGTVVVVDDLRDPRRCQMNQIY